MTWISPESISDSVSLGAKFCRNKATEDVQSTLECQHDLLICSPIRKTDAFPVFISTTALKNGAKYDIDSVFEWGFSHKSTSETLNFSQITDLPSLGPCFLTSASEPEPKHAWIIVKMQFQCTEVSTVQRLKCKSLRSSSEAILSSWSELLDRARSTAPLNVTGP